MYLLPLYKNKAKISCTGNIIYLPRAKMSIMTLQWFLFSVVPKLKNTNDQNVFGITFQELSCPSLCAGKRLSLEMQIPGVLEGQTRQNKARPEHLNIFYEGMFSLDYLLSFCLALIHIYLKGKTNMINMKNSFQL